MQSRDVEHRAAAAKPADPVKTGYSFDGWFMDSELLEAYDFGTPVTGNLTLYAGWTPLPLEDLRDNMRAGLEDNYPGIEIDGEIQSIGTQLAMCLLQIGKLAGNLSDDFKAAYFG